MDVANFVDSRRAEIDAFSKLVFKPTPASGTTSQKKVIAPSHRRPASDNTPLSHTVRKAKDEAKRKRRRTSGMSDGLGDDAPLSRIYSDYYVPSNDPAEFAMRQRQGGDGKKPLAPREAAAAVRKRLRTLSVRRRHQRPLTPEAWKRHRKRRTQLLVQRRLTVFRRKKHRQRSLRYGKLLPLCACCPQGRSHLKMKQARRLRTQRRQTIWLPSHRHNSKSFHFLRYVIHLRGSSAKATHTSPVYQTDTVTVAVPWNANRKRHRCLQRWVSHLRYHNPLVFRPKNRRRAWAEQNPSTVAGESEYKCPSLRAPFLKYHPPNGALPPRCLLADLSHHCIYHVTPRFAQAKQDSVTLADWMFNCLGISIHTHEGHPESITGRVVHVKEKAPCRRGKKAPPLKKVPARTAGRSTDETQVYHGHAWSSDGFVYDKLGKPRLERTTGLLPAVLPITVVAVRECKHLSYWVVSEAPVHFPAKAHRACKIHLTSLWSPCTAGRKNGRFASMFECWRVHTPIAAAATIVRKAVKTALSVLQRAQDAGRRAKLRRMSVKKKEKKEDAVRRKPSTLPARRHYSAIVFPSLGRNDMSLSTLNGQQSAAEASVWSVLVVSPTTAACLPEKALKKTARLTATALMRREHFFISRLVFNGVLRSRAFESTTTETAPSRALLGYRAGTKVLGMEDRKTLLRLLGRPVYPDDYGYSDGCDLGEAWHVLVESVSRWGTRDNAHRRVLVRPAGGGNPSAGARTLPAVHSSAGTCLLRVECVRGTPRLARRIGLVTSKPFFAQSIGSVVAPVWILFPLTASALWLDSVLERKNAPAPKTDASAVFVLVSCDAADQMCPPEEPFSHALESADKRRRLESAQARRQRPKRGVLQGMLLNPNVCTFVDVLQLFV